MGQVRWAGWTMAVAAALVISGVQMARADVASDKPAAILIYPKVTVGVPSGSGAIDTVIRLTNTNTASPINAHCFYIDANSHCSNSPQTVCTNDPGACSAGGLCVPGWQETDFDIVLTPEQPISWLASAGLADARTCVGGSNQGLVCQTNNDCPSSTCGPGLPIAYGVCENNQFQTCGSDADCNPVPGGSCRLSNAGTRIPPVAENPFIGELKCIEVDTTGTPLLQNDLKGEALIETLTDIGDPTDNDMDVAAYNAIGIQATGNPPAGATNILTLGPGNTGEYNGCPNFLILDAFLDGATDPVDSAAEPSSVSTDLVLVPCSEDLLRQIPGTAVVQYLIYNEFEQRFSTSRTVNCFQDLPLCNIDTAQCPRSIFNVAIAGTLTGQIRMQPLGVGTVPSGLLGVAIETHSNSRYTRSAATNLDMSGTRANPDTITLP